MSRLPAKRRYDLDWVRIIAIGVLMLYHVELYYTTTYWHVKSLHASHAIGLLHDLADQGLTMSPGTLAGGMRALAPLFEPLEQALLDKLRGEPHGHADETRWAVFVELAGKVGHRWTLWVFHSRSVVHYVLDASRSADVVQDVLAGLERGLISCERYSAYKKFARLHPGVVLAFCRTHQRRDFLELANAHPDLSAWSITGVDAIAEVYRLNALRLAVDAASGDRATRQGGFAAGRASPPELDAFLPWAMDTARLAAMRACPQGAHHPIGRARHLVRIDCGREFSQDAIQTIRRLMEHDPSLKRTPLSRQLCELWHWRKPNGELEDMSCRVALLRLHADGLITLPPSRTPGRRSRPDFPPTPATEWQTPLLQPVHELGAPIKEIWLYPLRKNFSTVLCQ